MQCGVCSKCLTSLVFHRLCRSRPRPCSRRLPATGVVLLKGLELGKFWLIGAAIAAIPHAVFVYYAGRHQQQADVRYTLRSTHRGMALKMALTAVLFMWAFKAFGGNHTVVMLLGFVITTLAGVVYPLLKKRRQ